tara:strand:- start:131 stop:403 length:273 start_codon:yes stop_codon:yes gene_type:complete
LDNLINEFGQIIRWPTKQPEKTFVVNFLATKFYTERTYTEKEINDIVDKSHLFDDIALLRRELISRKKLDRKDDGSMYWKIIKSKTKGNT